MINKSRIIGANSFDKNVFFIFWFHLTNLFHLRVGKYKKEANKLFTSIDKRKNKGKSDIKNKNKSDKKEVSRPDIAAVENLAIIEDKSRKNEKNLSKINAVIAEDSAIVKNPTIVKKSIVTENSVIEKDLAVIEELTIAKNRKKMNNQV